MTKESLVKSIFEKAIRCPPTEREALLAAACPDATTRREVDRLLAEHERSADDLDATTATRPQEVARTQIGPYRVMEKIGEGGFGVVYVAEQTHPVRRKVALKVIKPGMDSREVIARFEAEQQALALMDHPNIAKVIDAGTTEQARPYFVMELVHGVQITEFCDQSRLATEERLRLFVDVCHAVQHAHGKGIIHRDLKPNNILVTLHDGRPVPKVIDFGVAKALSQRLTEKTVYTSYGQMIGTPEYMSPEQAEMSGLGVDTRSDIYSLGVLLYELLVGQTPFEAERLRAAGFEGLVKIIREEEPPRPSTRISTLGKQITTVTQCRATDERTLRQQLAGELDWIVMKAIEKDRTRRYETANSLAADIGRYLADEPVEACPPSTSYRLRKFARKHKATVTFAAAVFSLLVLGLAGTSVGLHRARVAAREAKASEENERRANAKLLEEHQQTVAAKAEAERAQQAERRTNFHMAFDRGLALCEAGHVGSGMLWFVRALELAPDEEFAMTRMIRANLSAWRRELHTLKAVYPQANSVSTVVYGPQEDLVFTGTTDGVLQIWDRHTEDVAGLPLMHGGQVHEIPFSADRKFFLTASYDKNARLWELSSQKLLHTFEHASSVYGALFTPAGRIVTSTAGGQIFIWENEEDWTASDAWEATELPLTPSAVHDIALSPDGDKLAATSHDGRVVIWDLAKREPIVKFEGHLGSRVSSVVFRTAKEMASSDTAGNVYFWSWGEDYGGERASGVEASYRHLGGVHRLRLSGDGKQIVTASFDNTAQLLNAATGKAIGPPIEHQAALQYCVISRDGRVLTSGGDGNAREFQPASRSLIETIEHPPSTQPAIYTKDVRFVIIKYVDDTARIFDTSTGELVGKPIRPEGGIYVLAVNRDASLAVTGGAQGIVQFWSTVTGRPVGEPFKHDLAVSSIVFSPDEDAAYSAALDGVVKRWNARTGVPLASALVDFGSNSVRGMAISPDGSRLALATSKRATYVVAATTGDRLQTLPGHQDMVMQAAFSPNGKQLCTAGFDNTAFVFDVDSASLVAGPLLHRGPIWHDVAYGESGTAVVTACEDRTARIWDVATGKPIGPRLSHDSALRAVTFRGADSQLLTGTARGKTRIWNVSSHPLQAEIEHLRIWLEVSTGREFDVETGEFKTLAVDRWQQKRSQLAGLGGPPS